MFMWKGILYTAIFFAVILLIIKLFFWSLPYILIAGAGIYVYKKYISPKLNKSKKENAINYSYTTKKIDVEPQKVDGFANKNDTKVIDVEYKEINK